MDSLSEKLSYKRSNKDQKQPRLSKASIGPPIERNGQVPNMADASTNPESCYGPSMSMKVIIVHRDEKGYGLTLSGDNPIYIQSVKEDGPASRSGVVQGDRLLKVNGDTVTNKNHVEVVRLFKADNYVALTLFRTPETTASETSSTTSADASSSLSLSASLETTGNRPPAKNDKSNQSKDTPAEQLTKNDSFHVEKVQTMRKMLAQEEIEVERIKEKYAENPDQKTLKELGQAQKLLQDLKKQLWKIEGSPDMSQEIPTANMPSAATEVDELIKSPSEPAEDQISLINMDDPDQAETNEKYSSSDALKQKTLNNVTNSHQTEVITETHGSVMVIDEDKTNMDLVKEFLPNNPFMDDPLFSDNGKAPSQQQNVDIMNFEDDDIAAKCDSYQDHGAFIDLEALRQRPAYLAVFFNYVIGTKEPAEFLLTLAVDNYKLLSNTKDILKAGDSIFKTYLGANAVYRIEVDSGISQSIQTVLTSKNPAEEALRCVFDPAVQVANKKIRNQLSEYRMKREQGLGSLFGDEKLQHAVNIDQQTDIRIVDEIITPTLNELTQKVNASDDIEHFKQTIVLEALQAFLNQYGTRRVKKPSNKLYSYLRSKPNVSLMKSSRSMGSQDSILDEANNRKGVIGGIFKGRKRNDSSTTDKGKGSSGSKRDKSNRNTIWENTRFSEPLKPVKVGASADPAPSGTTGQNDVDDRNLAHGWRSDRSESMHNPSSNAREMPMRPKSMPPDEWTNRGRAHTVSITPSPCVQEPVLNNHNPCHDDESESVSESTESVFSDKSLRRRRDDEKRLSLVSNKSNSDPDKNKVLQAVVQHNASNEQLEMSVRSHALSSAESTLSLNIEDKKILDMMPSFSDDPEVNIDATEQQWTDIAPRAVTKDLDKKEIKRQQIINELLSTEKHHVRDLRILEKLFYERFLSEGSLTNDEVNQMFPNLKEILKLHRELNKAFTEIKDKDGHVVKSIGDALLSRFDGEGGNLFKNECASYCGNQSSVLSFIKEKTKKDQNFKQYLQVAQRLPVCRKFHLKDFIPLEFQRLTKYPLLLENIAKNTKKKQSSEIEKVKKACQRCRDILAFVNDTVKEAEDRQKIIEIQQGVDREPLLKSRNNSSVIKLFKDIDLTEKAPIHQGSLTWKIGLMEKRKAISLYCILYDDVLVLVQKQEDRYILKCQGSQAAHAPFIRMDAKVIVRNVATDKRAFFVMPTSDKFGPQMYELVATTAAEMKLWVKVITDTSRKKESLTVTSIRRSAFSAVSSTVSEPAGELIGRGEENHSQSMHIIPSASEYPERKLIASSPTPAKTDDLLLKIKEKDKEISHALSHKFKLLARLSGLDENELEQVLDISAADREPEPGILVKHSILCVDKLQGLLNESATPENTFVKSRNPSQVDVPSFNQSQVYVPSFNQSQVDVPSFNQMSVEMVDNSYHGDTSSTSPEKWAVTVPHPVIRTSTVASASSTPEDIDPGDTHDDFETDEPEQVFSPDAETSADNDEFVLASSEVPNPERASFDSCDALPELNDRLSPSTNQADNSLPGVQQTEDTLANIETDDVPSPSTEQTYNLSPSVEQNDGLMLNLDQTDKVSLHLEQTDNLSPNAASSELTCESSRNLLENSDDAISTHSKSRPLSGIEICAPAGDVPVSKLMEIVMCLQTQLTQLMHVTEEDEFERRRLREENAQLREKIQTRQSGEFPDPPSYVEAVQQGVNHPRLRMTSSMSSMTSSLAQDCAVVRTSWLHKKNEVEPTDETPSSPSPTNLRHVTRRSTGF